MADKIKNAAYTAFIAIKIKAYVMYNSYLVNQIRKQIS